MQMKEKASQHLSGFVSTVTLMLLLVRTSKGPVKLIKRVKIAHLFSQYVSDQFHVIILSLLM